MKATHYTAFLCGCFSKKKNSTSIANINPAWEKQTKTKEEISVMEKFYYPEFVSFCYPLEGGSERRGMQRYALPVNETINLKLYNGKEHSISVIDIKLFILPYDMIIYAIQIAQDGAKLDDITASLSILRNISDYKEELINGAWGNIMQPIVDIFKEVSPHQESLCEDGHFRYFNLMENGNKLKLFQIFDLEKVELDEEKQNQLLFELGTLSPIGSYNNSSFTSPSKEYFEKIMELNKISVFNNWKALSLFDTFSILSYSTKPYLLENWNNAYFGMIYIHSLFLKFYLFRMNVMFRKKNNKISKLENEFLEFERNCCFHKISYNFLPLEIYEYLDVGLEINQERKQIYAMIQQERNAQEKESERRMNGFLFFLTCLTVFSTVWDFSCLFNQIYPYEQSLGSTAVGYRVVTSTLLLLVLIIVIVYRLSGRKR